MVTASLSVRIHPCLLLRSCHAKGTSPRHLGSSQERIGLGILAYSNFSSLPIVRFPNNRFFVVPRSLLSTSPTNAATTGGGGGVQKPSHSYPSFTTGESLDDFVKSPALDICTNVALLGKANVPFKGSDIDIDEFSQGALYAIEVVTSSLALTGDERRAALGDQLTRTCLGNLSDLDQFSHDQRKMIEVKKEDVFFSWIAGSGKTESGDARLVFATMSMPKFAQMKREFEENNRRSKAFMNDMKERRPDPEKAKQMLEEFKITLHEPFSEFKKADLIIANFVFVQKDGQWLIDKISMRPSREVYNTLYYFRCKGRVGFALRNFKYIHVLRYDYLSDFFVLTLCTILVISSLTS